MLLLLLLLLRLLLCSALLLVPLLLGIRFGTKDFHFHGKTRTLPALTLATLPNTAIAGNIGNAGYDPHTHLQTHKCAQGHVLLWSMPRLRLQRPRTPVATLLNTAIASNIVNAWYDPYTHLQTRKCAQGHMLLCSMPRLRLQPPRTPVKKTAGTDAGTTAHTDCCKSTLV